MQYDFIGGRPQQVRRSKDNPGTHIDEDGSRWTAWDGADGEVYERRRSPRYPDRKDQWYHVTF